MKKIYSTIIAGICLMIPLFFQACTDDDIVKSKNIKEGVPVELKLNFSAGRQAVNSRAVQTNATEYNVAEIYLFVFNSDGSLDNKGIATISGGNYDNTAGTSSGQISSFEVHSGTGKQIYAVANADDMLKERLTSVNNFSELESIVTRLSSPLDVDRLFFLMEGVMCKKTDNTTLPSVDIDENGNVTADDGADIKILLRRIDARITFKIEVGAITATTDGYTVDRSTAEFIPRRFEVHNLPEYTHVFSENDGAIQNPAYNSMDSNSSLSFDSEASGDLWFNFYMYENNQVSANRITADIKPKEVTYLYDLREKQVKDDDGQNGTFKYAPENATYVVFTGDLSFEQTNANGETQYVNASVSYTVHLGETGTTETDWNDPNKVNNYTVKRNTHYTYNVSITGLNSIQVEVTSETGEEPRPGLEGDVVVAGAQVEAIDAHYGRALIKISKEAIEDPNGLTWIIQTPFDRGYYKSGSGEVNTLKDYKWILFAINKQFGIDDSTVGIDPDPNNPTSDGKKVNMVKFPGYDAYDGGASIQSPTTEGSNNIGNNFGNKTTWKDLLSNNSDYQSNFYYPYRDRLRDDACLRDVNQLINYLRTYNGTESLYDDDEYVYITAFVDEYVYIYDPRVHEYEKPGPITDSQRLLLWKEVVNKEDRLMHICQGGANYSADGNSSWSNSVVTFKQAPIYTIYNENNEDLVSAWGTESIIEGDVVAATLPTGNSNTPSSSIQGSDGQKYSNTADNGRINTLLFFINSNGTSKGIKWGDVLNRTASELNGKHGAELKDDYRDIWHACMMRNRDINGNNIIEANEIRWYLASIDQLTDIWIGEDALPTAAKLYQGDGSQRLHVASSSYYTGKDYGDPFVIWAEEGASKGAYSASSKQGNNANGSNYYYRCVRNLGIGLDKVETVPDDYVITTENNGATTIDVSRLGRLAKRTNYDGGRELPDHTERGVEGNNRPFEKFEIYATDATTNNNTYYSNYWAAFANSLNYSGVSRICPNGYRVPNQRELMLMYTSIENWSGYYWCATKFSYNTASNWTNSQRPGFAYNHPNMVLINLADKQGEGSNTSNKVRCVRDVRTITE